MSDQEVGPGDDRENHPDQGHHHHHGDDHHHHKIEVLVNEKEVILKHQNQTGLSIKEAAIAQGVAIQTDFVLSIERGGGKTELIGNDDHIKVHRHERFLAIPNDDNS